MKPVFFMSQSGTQGELSTVIQQQTIIITAMIISVVRRQHD